jgi:hypothetical protein
VVAIAVLWAITLGPALLIVATSQLTSNPALKPLVTTVALADDLAHKPQATTANALMQIMPFLIFAWAIGGPIYSWASKAKDAYQLAKYAKDHLSRNSSQHNTIEPNSTV